MTTMNFITCYLLSINVFTFFVYGLDKYKARKHQWRIPEATLMFLALIGGSIGALMAMHRWRHKTNHLKFRIGIPVIILLQIALTLLIVVGY